MLQAKTPISVQLCFCTTESLLELYPCGYACCWSQCFFGMNNICYVLLVLFLSVFQVCVMYIFAFCFISTSDKVEAKKPTQCLEGQKSNSVQGPLEEQVPLPQVRLHEIAVFCTSSFMLFYKIPELLIVAIILFASQN